MRKRRCPICGGQPGFDCDCWETHNEEMDEHAQEGAEFGCSVPVAEEEGGEHSTKTAIQAGR